jgi:hypothetical protein
MVSLYYTDNFLFFIQLCPRRRSTGSWPTCLIRTHRPRGPTLCRFLTAMTTFSPSVRITVLLLTFFLAINTFLWLVTQDLYPDWEIDIAMSDEDNVGPNEPAGNDAIGNEAPSAKTLAPHPIGSSSVGETRPSTADRAISTAPSGSGQKKKHVVLGTMRKQDKATDDQVIIELPPYRGPQSPLDIVTVEHIFGRLFEAFRHISQAVRIDASAGDDAQPSKRAHAPSLKNCLCPSM